MSIAVTAGGAVPLLGKVFCNRRLRTIAFQESIPAVEELHHRFTETLERDGLPSRCFDVFTANFLADERVEKLETLRSGTVQGVVSTSALSLGIDIGELSCAALITYPGNMAKAWQMLGRAGRRGPGLQLFLLGDGYLDRYWEEHGDEFLDQTKHLEELVIMPDNPHILAEHLVAAHFDHPLKPKRDAEFFGRSFAAVFREQLLERGLVVSKGDNLEYFEMVDADRVFKIALRGTGAFKVPVFRGSLRKPILEEDQVRAIRRLYPGAIFIHDGKFYRVTALRYEHDSKRQRGPADADDRPFRAIVEHAPGDQITVPIVRTDIESLDDSPRRQQDLGPISARLGRVRVRTSVDQFYQVPYDPIESADAEVAISTETKEPEAGTSGGVRKLAVQRDANTPVSHVYETDGVWIVVPEIAFVGIDGDEARYSALFSVGKAVTRAIPLLHYCGSDDLLFTPFTAHPAADQQSALFVYERTRGGVGLAERTFERLAELLNNALYEVIEGCKRCKAEPASEGCPGCIADISGLHNRRLAIRLLTGWVEQISRGGKRKARSKRPDLRSPEAALESVGFEHVSLIGEGGMGQVFAALKDGRRWALKIAAGPHASRQECEALAREGLRQKRLAQQWGEHPGILPVHEVITVAPYVFLQLEYADGGSLEDRIGPAGYMPPGARGPHQRAIQAVRQIFPALEAVAHLHDCGWVHRDIKPGNIVFLDATAKLADFGIAHRQAAGDEVTAGAGTPGYAAPGQIATQSKPDYRDDVYSIGVLLVRVLTGRIPRVANSGAALPTSLPEALRAIVKKATVSNPTGRYPNAKVLCDDLRAALDAGTRAKSKKRK